MLILLIPFAIIMVGAIIFLIIACLSQKKYDNFILQNSLCLKQLNEINQRYKFYPYISFDQYNTYDNEKLFDNISCSDYLIYQLQYIGNDICNQIDKININNRQYSKYLSEIKSISQFGQYQVPIGNLNRDKLIKREKIIIERQQLHAPAKKFTLTVVLYCSKINGEIYSQKSAVFTVDDILTFITRLNKRRGTYYADREIWDAICRVERGKVSNKLRFAIYQRDGYRCRKCGVSDGYADLEIDHIIPISKGGKSTYDNLQTLCHKCNVEKGNRL